MGVALQSKQIYTISLGCHQLEREPERIIELVYTTEGLILRLFLSYDGSRPWLYSIILCILLVMCVQSPKAGVLLADI